ncbi:MAG: dihydroorotase, partial [Thermoprotei archaeon]
MDRIVYKGLIYDRNGLRKSTVIIEDGIIAKIYDGIVNISGEIVLDYSNYKSIVAFPGFIDLHVHLRDFNYAYKETIESGTKAAVHGGITIVGDMPNTSPRVDNQSVLSKRIKLLKEESYADFYIYVDVSVENISDVEDMLKNPHVAGIKLYPDKYYVLAYDSIFHLL